MVYTCNFTKNNISLKGFEEKKMVVSFLKNNIIITLYFKQRKAKLQFSLKEMTIHLRLRRI